MSATTAVAKKEGEDKKALLPGEEKKKKKKTTTEKKTKKEATTTGADGEKKKKKKKTTKKEGEGDASGEEKKKKKKKKIKSEGDDAKDKKKKKKKATTDAASPSSPAATTIDVQPRSVQQLVKDVQDTKSSGAEAVAGAVPAADDSDDEGDSGAVAAPIETSEEKSRRIIKETKDGCRHAIALTSLQLKDEEFPEEFSDLEDIATTVDLSFNLLTDIPMPLLLLSNLQRLKMQGNMLERFSLLRGAFASLQELDLNGNNLMSLPSEIGYLVNLRLLNVSDNRLATLPLEIGALTKLEELRLSGNILSELPKTIGNCSRLEILDLVGCKLKQLPDQITYLGKLVELDVSANLLESLPEAFGLLPRLNELKANNNALTDLPVSIACIPHLQRMSLNGNAFTDDDLAVFSVRSSNALLSYLKERLTTVLGDPKQVREHMKELSDKREPLVQVIAPLNGESGFEIKEKLSAEKELLKKAETDKKDIELRDKILHLKKLSVDQYSTLNEWVYEMKNKNWAQANPQDAIGLATYVGQLKNQLDVMKERIGPYVMENYKVAQAQEGEDKMTLLKKSVDVSLDNVSVVVRALMKAIREEPDMGKVVLFAKDLLTLHDHFGKYFAESSASAAAETAQ